MDIKTRKIPFKAKHNVIYENLCGRICKGEFCPGDRIPTEMELSQTFGTTRPTVNKALKQLEQNGLIYRRQGSGSFVSDSKGPDKAKTYSVLMPWLFGRKVFDHGIFDTIVSNIAHQGFLSGYSLVIAGSVQEVDPNDYPKHRDMLIKELADKGVSGVIYMPPAKGIQSAESPADVAEGFHSKGIAVVLLDHDFYEYPRRSRFDLVDVKNRHGAYLATEHLIKAGCKNIHFVTPLFVSPPIKARKDGFCDALSQYNISGGPQRIHEIDPDNSSAMVEAIKKDGIDGLVCVNDILAAQVMRSLLAAGIQIPDDVKMVGFDNNPIAEHLPVPLTTMKQPIESLSRESIKILIERIENPNMPTKDVSFSTELIIRQSCGTNV